MKKIINILLNPNKFIGALICIISAILLIIVFSVHLENTFVAYFSYLLSAYSLIIFCIWFCKACKFSSDWIKNTKYYRWYRSNYFMTTKLKMILSLIINLICGIFKLITGFYYKSLWLVTFAAYYLILFIMKLLLIQGEKSFGDNLKVEFKKLKNTGIILLLLNLILAGINILVITQNKVVSYSGFLIYLVALYDFYLIITAIVNVIKYRKNISPIVSASKCISLSVAMISMLSLEAAMIYQFGNNNSEFKIIMTLCTGFGIAIINTVMSIIMIKKGNKYLRNEFIK